MYFVYIFPQVGRLSPEHLLAYRAAALSPRFVFASVLCCAHTWYNAVFSLHFFFAFVLGCAYTSYLTLFTGMHVYFFPAGKTLIAKACAGEAGVPFLYACGSDFNGV